MNPTAKFRDLSNQFVGYAQGNPLALKVLGSKLYTKLRKEWESEMDRLKEYGQPEISQILKSSFDGLDELKKNLFLDIACFFKGECKYEVEKVLRPLYNGAVCGISNLVDKCLFDISYVDDGLRNLAVHPPKASGTPRPQFISMHDMVENMGKDIGKCSRLWDPENVNKVLRYNKVSLMVYLYIYTPTLSQILTLLIII